MIMIMRMIIGNSNFNDKLRNSEPLAKHPTPRVCNLICLNRIQEFNFVVFCVFWVAEFADNGNGKATLPSAGSGIEGLLGRGKGFAAEFNTAMAATAATPLLQLARILLQVSSAGGRLTSFLSCLCKCNSSAATCLAVIVLVMWLRPLKYCRELDALAKLPSHSMLFVLLDAKSNKN